jgi:hypothetical protein
VLWSICSMGSPALAEVIEEALQIFSHGTLTGMRYVIVIVVFGLQHIVESCLDSITVTSRGQVGIAVVRYDGRQAQHESMMYSAFEMVEGSEREEDIVARRVCWMADIYSMRSRDVNLQEIVIGACSAAIDDRRGFLSPPAANFVSNMVSAVIPAIDASMVNIVPLADLDAH